MINTVMAPTYAIDCNGKRCKKRYECGEGHTTFYTRDDLESWYSNEEDTEWCGAFEDPEHYCPDCQAWCQNGNCCERYPKHLDKCPKCGTAQGEEV